MSLGDVVAELVGEREAKSEGCAVGADQVDAGELGFFAAVLRAGGMARSPPGPTSGEPSPF